MAEEQKSRLANIIGLITALTGLIAALLAVTNALKPSLFGGGNGAAPTQAAANATLAASGNAATLAPATRAATPATHAAGIASRTASAGGTTGESSDTGATEAVTHHDSTADAPAEDTHKAADSDE